MFTREMTEEMRELTDKLNSATAYREAVYSNWWTTVKRRTMAAIAENIASYQLFALVARQYPETIGMEVEILPGYILRYHGEDPMLPRDIKNK